MNPDIKMSPPMLLIEEELPEQYKGAQQYLMDNFEEVPNELDPQLAWLVRNMAYQRALIIQQDAKIRLLVNILSDFLVAVADEADEAGSDVQA